MMNRKTKIFSCVMFAVLLFVIGIFCAGVFEITNTAKVAAEEVFKDEAPQNLEALQDASDGQLDYWANHLESFDGRLLNIVTPTRNQGQRNICWAYATVGAVETNILRKGIDENATKDNLDFDERVLAYARFNRDGLHDPLYLTTEDAGLAGMWNSGDAGYNAYETMTEGYALAGQNNSLNLSDMDAMSGELMQSKYYVKNFFKISTNTNEIKRAILKYGAVSFSYVAPMQMQAKYYSGKTNTNHESLIVGWDDSIDRLGFTPSQPKENGAWIVKNSWGPYGNNNKNGVSCFYMSYEEPFHHPYVVDVAMREDYQNIYHYDGQISSVTTNFVTEKQAAIYEAKLSSPTKQERLAAVTIYTDLSGIDVKVEIRKNLTMNSDKEMIDPEGGQIAQTTTAHIDIAGFHTIDLAEPVNLEQGEQFSIVISSKQANNRPVALCKTDGNSTNDMTYYHHDGRWESYKGGSYNLVAKIRAITNVVETGGSASRDLKYARIEIENKIVPYEEGVEVVPKIEVYFDEALLEQDKDYEVKIENNIFPGKATVTITGKNGFTGTRKAYFEVGKAKYPPGRISGTIKVYDNIKMAHDLKIPNNWQWIGQDEQLKIGKSQWQFSLKYVGEDAECYQNPYSSFYIEKIEGNPPNQIDLSDANLEILGSYTYTGEQIIPRLRITYLGEELREVADYELTYQSNTNAGTATVTVTGTGGYKGQISQEFKIGKARWPKEKPSSTMIVDENVTNLSQITLENDWAWQKTFNLTGDKTEAIAVYNGGDKKNYGNIKMPVTIVRKSGGESEQKDISLITLSLEGAPFVYDGSRKEPNVIAIDGGHLRKDIDFKVEYFENVNAGKARAVVSGLGKYTGTRTIYFMINRADIEGFEVSQEGWTYGQSAPQPIIRGEVGAAAVTFTYSDRQEGTFAAIRPTKAGNYWIKARAEQSQNYNAAESTAPFTIEKADHPEIMPNAEMTISRKAKTLQDVNLNAEGWQWKEPSRGITGEKTSATAVYFDQENYKNYSIQIILTKEAQKEASSLSVELEANNFVYNGSEWTPNVIAKDGEVTLALEEDFDVQYEGNKFAGQGRAIVTFKNDYAGRIELLFTISPARQPEVETTLKIRGQLKNLSEIELPDNFEWVEGSLQTISAGKMSARAIYKGIDASSYEITELTFEIIIEEEPNRQGGLLYLAIAIPSAALLALYLTIAIIKRKRKRQWE